MVQWEGVVGPWPWCILWDGRLGWRGATWFRLTVARRSLLGGGLALATASLAMGEGWVAVGAILVVAATWLWSRAIWDPGTWWGSAEAHAMVTQIPGWTWYRWAFPGEILRVQVVEGRPVACRVEAVAMSPDATLLWAREGDEKFPKFIGIQILLVPTNEGRRP